MTDVGAPLLPESARDTGKAKIPQNWWYIPTIAGLAQFGPQFASNIASLRPYFAADPAWRPHLGARRWESILAAAIIPMIIVPILAGWLVDTNWSLNKGLLTGLLLVAIGQSTFAIGAAWHGFTTSVLGRVIFGSGLGVVIALTLVLAVAFVPARRIYSLALVQAFVTLATVISISTVGPFTESEGFDYVATLQLGIVVVLISVLAGLLWRPTCEALGAVDNPKTSGWRWNWQLSGNFWLIAVMQFFIANSERLLIKSGDSMVANRADYVLNVSQLVGVFIMPAVAYYLDTKRVPNTTVPAFATVMALTGTIAYALLAMHNTPTWLVWISLVGLGFVNGFVPTLLRAAVAQSIPMSSIATAFGVYTAIDALGLMVGGSVVAWMAYFTPRVFSTLLWLLSGSLLIATLLGSWLYTRAKQDVRLIAGDLTQPIQTRGA